MTNMQDYFTKKQPTFIKRRINGNVVLVVHILSIDFLYYII